MKIDIELTKEELSELGIDENGLINHIIDTLDASDQELPGYNVNVFVISPE